MLQNIYQVMFASLKLSFASQKQIPLLLTKFGGSPPQNYFRLVLLFSATFEKSSGVFCYLATVITSSLCTATNSHESHKPVFDRDDYQ